MNLPTWKTISQPGKLGFYLFLRKRKWLVLGAPQVDRNERTATARFSRKRNPTNSPHLQPPRFLPGQKSITHFWREISTVKKKKKRTLGGISWKTGGGVKPLGDIKLIEMNSWLVVEPTPLKNTLVKNGFIFPNFRGRNEKNFVDLAIFFHL